MNPRLSLCLLPVLALAVPAARLWSADSDTPGRVVELPALTVAEQVNGPPWRYLQAPGLEILSRCSDPVTEHLAEEMNRLQQLIGVILPEELQVKLAVPVTVVLYSEENKPVVSQEVISELRHNSPGGDADNSRSRSEVRYRSLPNLRLTDRDAMDFFFIVDEMGFTSSALTVTPAW